MRTVTIYATGKCNLRCTHCSVGQDQYDPRSALSTDEFRKTLTTLAESGTKNVTILGGEASIYRRDLEELLDYTDSLGMRLSLNTNGIAKSLVLRLASKPALKSMVVSLDGAKSTVHDSIRGPGTFNKTIKTLQALTQTVRAKSGDLRVEIAHVISARNANSAAQMVLLAEELGVHQLSVKHVRMIGRARENVDSLELAGRELLDAYSSVIITWLLSRRTRLSVHVPPAFAYYLRQRFGLQDFSIESEACGGTSEYGYVDLLGNHLPCPAMSYEEDPDEGLMEKLPELSLSSRPANEIRTLPLFINFEHQRKGFKYRERMFPCKFCIYSDISRPCSADLVQGASEAEVDICSAVLHHGDETVYGLRSHVFPTYREEGK